MELSASWCRYHGWLHGNRCPLCGRPMLMADPGHVDDKGEPLPVTVTRVPATPVGIWSVRPSGAPPGQQANHDENTNKKSKTLWRAIAASSSPSR
jgi:hypothetical protein